MGQDIVAVMLGYLLVLANRPEYPAPRRLQDGLQQPPNNEDGAHSQDCQEREIGRGLAELHRVKSSIVNDVAFDNHSSLIEHWNGQVFFAGATQQL